MMVEGGRISWGDGVGEEGVCMTEGGGAGGREGGRGRDMMLVTPKGRVEGGVRGGGVCVREGVTCGEVSVWGE